MLYSPLGIYASSTGATASGDKYINGSHQQYPSNASPASTSTCTSGGHTTAATRPATLLDTVSRASLSAAEATLAASAVCRASRSLQHHVSVWDDYDDDDNDGDGDAGCDGGDEGCEGEVGERRGLIRRVKGRVSRGLVFGRSGCGLSGGSVGSAGRTERKGGRTERKCEGENEERGERGREKERESPMEAKRRFVWRWRCGYL